MRFEWPPGNCSTVTGPSIPSNRPFSQAASAAASISSPGRTAAGGIDHGIDHSSPLFIPYPVRIRRATAVLWTSSAPS